MVVLLIYVTFMRRPTTHLSCTSHVDTSTVLHLLLLFCGTPSIGSLNGEEFCLYIRWIIMEDQTFYDVERIIGTRNINGKKEYRIKWKGFSKKYNTWEQEANIQGKEHVILEVAILMAPFEIYFRLFLWLPSECISVKVHFSCINY